MTTTTSTHQLTQPPIVKTGMLVRRPVSDVFEAFSDPAITSNFWFTKGSGKLETGATVQWDWEMYGASMQVRVKEIEQDRRILVEWPTGSESSTVEWLFVPRSDGTTFVNVTIAGFSGDGDEIIKQAIDSTEGFALMLAGLKAYLEHDIRLNLVLDRFPEGID